ncbi:uncharacterized protein LOC113790968 [Dermatophagoides pteronyssinus]|uniref:uncharacterized protein LOC113790968 n=1 Tax=Dermatophagoides pteronyssinus TaxID=6956 RepID=UPI003F67F7F0
MISILKELERIFKNAFEKAFPTLPNVTVEFTRSDYADFQCNNALKLKKLLPDKKNPVEIAKMIIDSIESNNIIENTTVSGPGFINITISPKFLCDKILEIILNDVHINLCNSNGDGDDNRPIIVDYSSPNIAKEMHVGHLRSTIIGDSVARLLEFVGHNVLRINHIGDWGTQFGMLLTHLMDTYPDFQSKPPPIEDLQTFYKQSKKRFDDDEDFKKRSLETTVQLQSKEPKLIDAWKMICDISRKEFAEIYQLLNISKNLIERGESFYQERMIDVVKDLEERGFLVEEDGRKVFYPKNSKVPPLTIVKSDGGFTYDTSDMAAIRQRVQEENASRIIYTTDAGQAVHFKSFFDCAEICGYYDPNKVRLDHLTFGVVLGEDRKRFKTRSGETVKLKDLINEGLERSRQKLLEKERDKVLTDEEMTIAQKAIAIGCIKYADLSHDRNNDYIFSFDRMLDDKGNTAVYLLYTITRIRSIIRNCNLNRSINDIGQELSKNSSFQLDHPREIKLAKFILNFPDIIIQIVDNLYLHLLCRFLFDLSVIFTEFYDQCYVIEKIDNNETKINLNRVILCEATVKIMETGLKILGIETVEKMKTEKDELETKITKLSNGLRVASQNKFGQFCTIGTVIDSGSRYERNHPNGISHFIEKLAFNSTEDFDSKDSIMKILEKYGGICDCQGSRDTLIYAASVHSKGLDSVMHLLSEAVLRPKFTDMEMEFARRMIQFELQDLDMRPDPEPILHEMIHSAAYRGNTLGLNRLCSEENINIIQRNDLFDYINLYHRPERMVIAGVGVEHDRLVELAEKFFVQRKPIWESDTAISTQLNRSIELDDSISQYTGGVNAVTKDLSDISLGPTPMPELAHFVIGLESVSHQDLDNFVPICVLNILMGGGGSFSAGGPGKGMYTRLYTRVLNLYHWMFSATALNHSYQDSGLFCIHASAHPKQLRELVMVILSEIVSLTNNGISNDELKRAKNQLKSMLLMNLEARPVMFEDIGRQVLSSGQRRQPQFYIDRIDKVSEDDLIRIAREMLKTRASITNRIHQNNNNQNNQQHHRQISHSNNNRNKAIIILNNQLRQLLKKPNDHFSVGLVDESNIFLWEIMIVGPRDTLYEGGLFKAQLQFPSNFPDSPPKMRFLSEMWHPNISKSGDVCISILHNPNLQTFGYEENLQRWAPVYSVETIVMSVISMLSDPNVESPANVDAAIQMRNHPDEYAKQVRFFTQKTLE